MNSISIVAYVGVASWVLACLAGVVRLIWMWLKTRQMEYVLWGGALLMLAMAPCISLVVYANSTSDSPTWMGGVVQIVAAVLLMLAGLRQRSVRKSPEKMSQSSFREKSDLLVLLSLCCVFLGYYALSWNLSAPAMVPILVGAVVVLVVINIVGHIALAVMHAPMDELNDGPDERDLGARRRGLRHAYYVLAVGIWIILGLAVFQVSQWSIANVAFGFMVIGEIVNYAGRMYHYRYGVT
ncbi:MAG: hypothetical protein KDC35_13315 [Acidobacteria bacterium]|nr:hypothetical protein [Acidobacteriota bacterium]